MTPRESEFIGRCLTVAAKAGFISRPVVRLLTDSTSDRTERHYWLAVRKSAFFDAPSFVGSKLEVTKLSSRGYEAAKLLGLSPVRVPHLAFFAHDDLALQIAVRLESMNLIHSWTTEMAQKQERMRTNPHLIGKKTKFPDLTFELNVPGDSVRFAVEVERTVKEHSRYDDLVVSYSGDTSVHAIIIAATYPSISTAIIKAANRLSYPVERRPFLFTNLADLGSNPATATLSFGGKVQTLSGIIEDLKSERRSAA